MFEDYDYEDYFEPGVIDEIIIDAIAKAKEKIKEGIKINLEAELTKNKTEKERLDKVNGVLNSRDREISKRERDIESKEKNMLKNFAKDFFKEANTDIVTIDYDSKLGVKCDNCDDDRYIEATDIFDRQHRVRCSCHTYIKTWKYKEPWKVTISIRNSWGDPLTKYTVFRFEDEDNYGYSCSLGKDTIYYSLEEFKEYAKDRDSFYGTYIIDREVARECVDYLNSRSQQ